MQPRLLTLILLGLSACSTEIGEACMPVPADGQCPDPADVDRRDVGDPWDCDNTVTGVFADQPTPTPTAAFQDGSSGCCYEATLRDKPGGECIVGRPFRQGEQGIVAEVACPTGDAAAWARMAAGEHASVAAFARLQLQLLALGAPLDLLEGCARAMADEVRHARLAFEVASRLAEQPVLAGPFPFAGPLEARVTLRELAVAAAREGCVGETLSALATREAAMRATDPEIRALLHGVADDEDRHAVFSWQIVAWALRVGGADVRSAVIEAFRAPHDPVSLDLLPGEGATAVSRAGMGAVVAPAITALLAA